MRALLLFILLLPLNVFADRIVLTDGKEYRGTFVDAEDGKVRFRISSRVVRTFPAANIARLEIGNRVASAAYRAATPQEANRQMRPRTPVARPQAEAARPEPAPPAQPTVTQPQLGTATTSPVQGADSIDSEYTRMNSETGTLGPPRAAHQATADGRASARFYNGGVIYWTPGAGAHALTGPILQAWLSQGGERSRLGYPTGDERVSNAGSTREQDFEGGRITWTETGGSSLVYTPR